IHLVLPAARLVQIAGRTGASARAQADGEGVAPPRSGRHCARSKSRSLHCPSPSISRWYFEGSVPGRGDGGCGFSGPRLYARWATPPRRAEKAAMSEKGPEGCSGYAAARDLRQRRVSDLADHRLAAIEQFGLGSGRRRCGHFGRAVHRIAALGRGERHTVALERTVDHRRAPSDRWRSGGRGNFKTNEENHDGENRAAAADEISRITPHGLLPTIPVLISRVNPRLGSSAALRFVQSAAEADCYSRLRHWQKTCFPAGPGAASKPRQAWRRSRRGVGGNARHRPLAVPIPASLLAFRGIARDQSTRRALSGAAGRPFPPPPARPVSSGVVDTKVGYAPVFFGTARSVPVRTSEPLLARWVLRLDIPATGTKQTERDRGAKR